jgi:dTMP kinase
MKQRGKFIVMEGIDGAGKSTQAYLIFDYLKKKRKKVHLTSEPTEYIIGGLIKSCLSHDWKTSPECLQLLFSADRAYHLEKEILPLLKKGVIVISDRYFFSTIAYGALEIRDFDWLLNLNRNFLLPDLIFFLKISPKEALKRIKKERFSLSLFEEEKELEKIWKNYEKLTKIFKNIFVIDGEKSIEKVFNNIKKILNKKLKL